MIKPSVSFLSYLSARVNQLFIYYYDIVYTYFGLVSFFFVSVQ